MGFDYKAVDDAFDPDDQPVIEAICRNVDIYEGEASTNRQTNPYPRGTLAYATWVIAHLGAWTEYDGKPGPLLLSRGLQKYHAINYGTKIESGLL